MKSTTDSSYTQDPKPVRTTPEKLKPADFPSGFDDDDGDQETKIQPESETTTSAVVHPTSHSQQKIGSSAKKFFKKAFSFGDVELDDNNSSSTTMKTEKYSTPAHHRVLSDNPTTSSESASGSAKAISSSASSSNTSSTSTSPHNNKKLNRGLSFGPTRPGLHGGGNIRWFHNLFPLRQVFVPKVPFPLWYVHTPNIHCHVREKIYVWCLGT